MNVMRTFTPGNNSHTGSRENLKLASIWLQRCLETHPSCNTDRIEAPTLPTRVIDVGPPDGSRPPFLFLTNNSRGVYVTLSHCWGRIPFITTSSATLAAREAAIPLRDMPKTFRHAVYVARTLRVRYLWIDSLCILQDSKRDWEIESSRMADYYTNALLTIAADDASDATKGCFRTRHIGDNKPVEVQLRFKEVPADKGARHYVRRLPPSLPADGRNDARSVLQTRGWTLQEEVLSRRILVFGEQQLSFQCLLDVATESYPEGWLAAGLSVYDRRPAYLAFRQLLPGGLRGPHSQVEDETADKLTRADTASTGETPTKTSGRTLTCYESWYALVEDFRSRELTKATDALPALAGLAIRTSELAGDTYLAGLWRNDLPVGLLWTVQNPQPRHHLRYTAPSWSWASMPGKIKFATWRNLEDQGYPIDFEVLDACSEVAGANPFGEIQSGMLRVRAGLMQVRVLEGRFPRGKNVFDPSAENPEQHRRVPCKSRHAHATAEQPLEDDSSEEFASVYSDSSVDLFPSAAACRTGSFGIYWPDAKEEWFGLVWCMPVLYHGQGRGDAGCGCVALVHTDDGDPDRFMRVGRIDLEGGIVGFEERCIIII